MSDLSRYFFYLFSLLTIGSALAFVTRKGPVPAALWLVNTMFALSGLYVLLDAPFVGAVQVLVYAGAIMVVFVFVVMLLNLGRAGDRPDLRGIGGQLTAGVVGAALLALLLAARRGDAVLPALVPSSTSTSNVVEPVAQLLFTDYLLAFELTSIVLLTALVGAVVLAKRRTAA
ncbi:MAG: NADH-quinone oxidoreductase subunit J [Gemmatimonadaceae bacterium]|jgi:NADH-quinone oxidoreductase subunit J|nr:NADH-quinone oxidoreductase subunit J [Gemmatimonadaceae bacterium]